MKKFTLAPPLLFQNLYPPLRTVMLQRFRLVEGVLRGDDRGWGAQAVFTGEVWGLRRGAGGQDPPVKRTGRVVIPLGTRWVPSPRDHPPMTPPHLAHHLTSQVPHSYSILSAHSMRFWVRISVLIHEIRGQCGRNSYVLEFVKKFVFFKQKISRF